MRNIDLPELFELLPAEALSERRCLKGEVVFHQGEPTGGLWFVAHGQVQLQRVTESGHMVLIHRAMQSDLFAEASLFSETYHCTAVSRVDSHLVELGREGLHHLLRDSPEFAFKLCAMLAAQVQSYRRLLEILSIRKAEERVFMAAAHGLLGEDIKGFSARIGLTHEAVYRALARLTAQGRLLKSGRGRYQMSPAEAGASTVGQVNDTRTDPNSP